MIEDTQSFVCLIEHLHRLEEGEDTGIRKGGDGVAASLHFVPS